MISRSNESSVFVSQLLCDHSALITLYYQYSLHSILKYIKSIKLSEHHRSLFFSSSISLLLSSSLVIITLSARLKSKLFGMVCFSGIFSFGSFFNSSGVMKYVKSHLRTPISVWLTTPFSSKLSPMQISISLLNLYAHSSS